ncbi:MAG: Maf family protein [Halopseudomonas sp.]
MKTSLLVLASRSPRRRELLTQIGVKFECASADIDESLRDGETPAQYVSRLALEKAQAVAINFPDHWVLGSDTTVVCDAQVLGKPTDKTDAVAMLQQLSGRRHQVMTAVALVQGERQRSLRVSTDVVFKSLSQAECERYWDTGEPQDKAGSYGIQGLGAVFVERVEGSYSAVVGLPLQEIAELLQQLGMPIWQRD